MKHIQSLLIVVTGFVACSVTAHAAKPIKVHWEDLCRVAKERDLVITSVGGSTISGSCFKVDANEIAVFTSTGAVNVARTAVSRVRMRRSTHLSGHKLRDLGDGLMTGLAILYWDNVPSVPVAVAAFSLTGVLGAIAGPVCLVEDLSAKVVRLKEIEII